MNLKEMLSFIKDCEVPIGKEQDFIRIKSLASSWAYILSGSELEPKSMHSGYDSVTFYWRSEEDEDGVFDDVMLTCREYGDKLQGTWWPLMYRLTHRVVIG